MLEAVQVAGITLLVGLEQFPVVQYCSVTEEEVPPVAVEKVFAVAREVPVVVG